MGLLVDKVSVKELGLQFPILSFKNLTCYHFVIWDLSVKTFETISTLFFCFFKNSLKIRLHLIKLSSFD